MNIYDVIEMIRLGEGWLVEFKELLPKPGNLAYIDLTGLAKLKIVQPEGTKRWRRYVLS